MKIYLIRHGETYSNIKNLLIGGGGNAPLTERGRHAAMALGVGLRERGIVFDFAYSSTLGRAYETAALVLGKDNIDIIQIEGIKDVGWGLAEGHDGEWLDSNYPVDDINLFFSENSPIEAETAAGFVSRFGNALDEIVVKHKGTDANILVVAHSSMAFYLTAVFKEAGMHLDNTSVSILEYEKEGRRLLTFNDTSYLETGKKLLEAQRAVRLTLIMNPLTLFQEAKILEGRSDSDFTPDGELAGRALLDQVTTEHFDVVSVSSLGRAKKLAAMLPDSYAYHTDPGLDEFFFGSLETMDILRLKIEYPQLERAVMEIKGFLEIVTPDGESGEIAAYRFRNSLVNAAEKAGPGGEVLIITHPYICSAFMEKYLPESDYIGTMKDVCRVGLSYKADKFERIF